MEALARTYAGLVVSDHLVAKALGISEIAQMARSETRLREYLIASWNRRQKQAIAKAVKMAEQLKPASQIASAVDKIMASWDKEILPALLAEIEKTYRLGRTVAWKKATQQTKSSLRYPIQERDDVGPVRKAAGAKRVAQLLPSFDLADDAAIQSLRSHQVLWVGDHYKGKVSESVAETTRTTMAEAGRNPAVAGKLMAKKLTDTLSHVKVPGGFHGSAPQYFEGLVANAMTVARVHGKIRSFMEIGITTYKINNPSDKRTCGRCAHLDGKTFQTKQGGEQMQKELGADNPDAVKAAHPWLSEKEIKSISPTPGPVSGKAGAADSKALADKGQALPPYHFKCRCTVDIGTDSKTYSSLQPLTAPVPKKPIVPKAPPRATHVSDWVRGLGPKEKEAFKYWSTDEGVHVMRKVQLGEVPKVLSPADKLIFDKAKVAVKNMEKGLQTAPNYYGDMYRGLGGLTPQEAAVFKKGHIIDQKAMSSWSKQRGIAADYATIGDPNTERWVLMEIRGSRGVHEIAAVSAKPMEAEVVMVKGKKMRVASVTKMNEIPGTGIKMKGMVVRFEEVADDALPALKPKPKSMLKPRPASLPEPRMSQRAWVNSLDTKEYDAFHYWANGGHEQMREYQKGVTSSWLKNKRPPSGLIDGETNAAAARHVKALEKALVRAPNYEGVVYRGMYDMDPKVAAKMAKKGAIIEQDAMSSWTRKKSYANEWTEYSKKDKRFVFMEVKTSKGAHHIESIVETGFEDEVLMIKGKKLKVVKVEEITKKVKGELIKGYKIKFEEVDDAVLPILKPKPKVKIKPPKPAPKPKPKVTAEEKQVMALTEGKPVLLEPIDAGANGAHLAVLETKNGKQIKGVWKAAKHDDPTLRRGSIKGGTYYKRESAFYKFDKMMGGETVTPPTVARKMPYKGVGSIQAFEANTVDKYDASQELHHALKARSAPAVRSLRKMSAMDVIAANDDRHGGNYMLKTVTSGGKKSVKVVAIDNGLTFPKAEGCRFFMADQEAIKHRELLRFDKATIKQINNLDLKKVAMLLREEKISDMPIKNTLVRIRALQNNPKIIADKYYKEAKKGKDYWGAPMSDKKAAQKAVRKFWNDAAFKRSRVVGYDDMDEIEDIIKALPK